MPRSWLVLVSTLVILHAACSSNRAPIADPSEFTGFPTPAVRVLPTYPPSIFRARRSGYVLFEFQVDQAGRIVGPHVVSSEPGYVYDRVSLSAVRLWKYEPLPPEAGKRLSRPVRSSFVFCFRGDPCEYDVLEDVESLIIDMEVEAGSR